MGLAHAGLVHREQGDGALAAAETVSTHSPTSENHMKRWPKNSIVRDVAKRRAIHRFLKSAISQKCSDGRIGLVVCLAWDAGYEAMRRRAKRQGCDGA